MTIASSSGLRSPFRLRRSVLYMPSSNARALEKARGLPADCLIFDLEDAVALDAKEQARSQAIAAADSRTYGQREIVIRVNGLDTPWGRDDIAAAASSACDAVLFPKIDSAIALQDAVDSLDRSGCRQKRVWAMMETPLAVLNALAIASASDRLDVLVIGAEDLAKTLRVSAAPPRTALIPSLAHCLLAARARALDILDGVFTDIADESGFSESCRQGRVLGFDGKTLIHPQQIMTANRTFGVTADEAAAAEEIIAAWDAAAASGGGIAVLRGRMIERLHADEARRVVAVRRAIEAAGG
jgi:citrate lyase subunit beta/citryl-CoA lyase